MLLGMDAQAPNRNPLRGLREKLLQTAARTKKPHIDKLEERLHELAQRYAQVFSEYRAACAQSTRRQDDRLSPEAKLLEAEKTKLEKERDEVRVKLAEARASWLPQLLAATAPLLTEANEVLHDALALIEAAAEVHE